MLGLGRIFGKETVVGVDIGSRLIKVVQADAGRAPGEWRITRAAVGATPADAVRDGVIVNRPAVAQALRDLFALAAIEATAATAAISGSSVIVRHVKMPRMAESVLRKSVRFEAGKYISSSVEDSLIEFEITGPVPGEDDKMGVMLVAAPGDMVESRLLTLSEAGRGAGRHRHRGVRPAARAAGPVGDAARRRGHAGPARHRRGHDRRQHRHRTACSR